MRVRVKDGNIDRAIRDLRKRIQKSGLLRELTRASFFETRTQRRKRKDRAAMKRFNKNRVRHNRRMGLEGA